MKNMKVIACILAIIGLFLTLTGVSYSFFIYSRAGSLNTITLGRVSFNHTQSALINLSNAYPIDVSGGVPNNNSNVGTFVINITGDTDSEDGIEYLVSTYDFNAETSTDREVPISVNVTVSSLGTESNNYFEARENTNASIYKKIASDTITGNERLLVGFITKNPTVGTATGINGSITIKAYLDADLIEVVNDENHNTTPGKEIFTMTEWNSLQTNGLSFKIKVEAKEGIWVEEETDAIPTCPGCKYIYTIDNMYMSWNRFSQPVTVVDENDLSDNYLDVVSVSGKEYFLGIKTNGLGQITNAYACGIRNNNPFCIEGTEDGSENENNIDILQIIYSNTCEYVQGEGTMCGPWNDSGVVSAITHEYGNADVGVGNLYGCYVHFYGDVACFDNDAWNN